MRFRPPARLAALIGLAFVILLSPMSCHVDVVLAQDAPTLSRVGVNLEGAEDHGRDEAIRDAIKTSRRFGTPADKPWTGPVAVDADGWPLADFGVVVFSSLPKANGVYKGSFTGRATKVFSVASPLGVRNLAYDAAANRSTFEVHFGNADQSAAQMILGFSGTQRTATSPANSGVTNLQLLRPGYDSIDGYWTDVALERVAPFGILRGMDLLKTNHSTITTWAGRSRLSDAQWSTKGVPYEVLLTLGQRTKKGVYIHVPHGADAAFVTELARLCRSYHASGAPWPLYIEFSNEIPWNMRFRQGPALLATAQAMIAADPRTSINVPAQGDVIAASRLVAKRAVEIRRAFDVEYGADPKAAPYARHVRVILGGQAANPSTVENELAWVQQHYGPPKDYFYAIAVAPYFAGSAEHQAFLARADLTPQLVAQHMLDNADVGSWNKSKQAVAIGTKFGVRVITYECGVDLGVHDKSVAAKIAAQQLPMAGQAVSRHLESIFAGGFHEAIYFNLTTKSTKNGYWGLLESVREPAAPKYAAAVAVAAKYTSPPLELKPVQSEVEVLRAALEQLKRTAEGLGAEVAAAKAAEAKALAAFEEAAQDANAARDEAIQVRKAAVAALRKATAEAAAQADGLRSVADQLEGK